MNKFRKSSIARLMSFLMAIAIFTTSCSDYIANEQLDSQSDKVLAQYSGFMSAEECATFKTTIDAVKSYVWQQRKNGLNPSRSDIAAFVYELNVQNGTITQANQADKAKFVDFVKNHPIGSGNQEGIINAMVDENFISTNVGNILKEFKTNFENVTTFPQAYSVIENMKTSPMLANLTPIEKDAVKTALDGAEKAVCYQELSQNDVETRGLCELCYWQINWVAVVISMVVTVVSWILAIVTFGLSTLVTSVVLVTVWSLTWVYLCVWIDCEEDPCPEGQTPSCEGSFTYDASIPACTRGRYASDDYIFLGCIYSPLLPSGGCPPGSIKRGTKCEWECFDQDPVMNSSGNWQIPFTCK